MSDRGDRILDACLEEVLGGHTPPDLSGRILEALASSPMNGAPVESARKAPIVLRDATPSSNRTSRSPAWWAIAVAASLLAALVGYSLFNSWKPDNKQPDLAVQPEQPGPVDVVEHREPMPPEKGQDAVAKTPSPETPVKQPSPPEESVVKTNPPVETPEVVTPPGGSRPPLASAGGGRDDEEIVAEINTMIRRRWSEEGVKPAVAATDAEWCRRVYLDIAGRVPSYDETSRFLAERGPQKRVRLIERLLDSDDGVQEYARNWTNIWTALLIGRSDNPGSLANRDGMQQYLRRAFLRNKPYDQLVAELISAEGSNTPGSEDFNGAVNFVLDNLAENGISATAKTARLFLGMQVQCTQCHNHPFNDWKQDQFWSLNAFYRQAKAQPIREGNQTVGARLVDVDFAGEDGDLREARVYWELRNGLLKCSYPTFIDGTHIPPSGAVAEVNRRDELARLVARSEEMPRAMVNRLWGHFLGFGFTRQVDDMGPHNPVSHPELLSALAGEFRLHGYDLKRLIRWIALSEPYALSSRIPPASLKAGHDDPLAGDTPLFSYFYVRQMRPEELYESLVTFAGHRNRGETFEVKERAKSQWMQQFMASYNTEENDEYTTFNGSITQTLAMFNGELMRDATKVDKATFLKEVAASNERSTAKISQLFTAALARRPTSSELQLANQLWLGRKGDDHAALQDIWWAVLNSNEFIMNH